MTADEIWNRLRDARLVSGTAPLPEPDGDPWPLRLLQGAGGWLGAVFLLGSMAAALFGVTNSKGALLVFGLLMMAGAIPLLRSRGGMVVIQFGLAVSIAAQGAIAGGVYSWFNDWGQMPAMCCALSSALLLVTTPQPVHRWWCAAIGAGALFALAAQDDLMLLTTGPVAVAVALLLLRSFPQVVRYQDLLRPLGWGLGSAWAVWFMVRLAGYRPGRDQEWGLVSGSLEMAAVLVATALILRQARVPWSQGWPVLLAALVPAGLGLVIPGSAVAIVVLLVAVAERDRLLLAVGVIGLLLLIGAHYQLDHKTPLIAKAVGLGIIGLVALVLRAAVVYGGRRIYA